VLQKLVKILHDFLQHCFRAFRNDALAKADMRTISIRP